MTAPSDYSRILEDNLCEYGHGTRHLAFLGRLYTDRTHFILELLQNAEDAEANKVLFVLSEDKLEVWHDGRPFNEKDVRGICGVGDGTKAEDLTQIGKFGIGFKSVYAYTCTPEIHSGDEHFRIDNYVRPCAAAVQQPKRPWTTLFVFPFNHAQVSPETAAEEIGERLRTLNARTLLFLRHLEEISWRIEGGDSGQYLREIEVSGNARRVTVLGQANGNEDEEEWLLFERPVEPPDGSDPVRVEIGYMFGNDGEAKGPNDKRGKDAIVRLSESPLVVFFPTEKETRLGFLVQGPYRTTPPRDNVPKNDEWNRLLVCETGHLVAASLSELQSRGLLTTTLLEALPIQPEAFPSESMFRPIYDEVRTAFRTKPLLPTDGKTWVPASHAVLARGAELRDILNEQQLKHLLGRDDHPRWLIGNITRERTPLLRQYLIEELEVIELDPEKAVRQMSNEFFGLQDDEWMCRFYAYLIAQEALWRKASYPRPEGPLRNQPFIRLDTGKHVAPFKPDGSPNVYLPCGAGMDLPAVKQSIAQDEQALDFLKRLELYAPDVADEVLNSVLPKYQTIAHTGQSIPPKEHAADVRKILLALRTDSTSKRDRVVRLARKTAFIRGKNASTDAHALIAPSRLYLGTPDLRKYFEGNSKVWFVAENQHTLPLSEEDRNTLGLQVLPRRIKFTPRLKSNQLAALRRHPRSTLDTALVDYQLEGLGEFLARIGAECESLEQRSLALILWKLLIDLVPKTDGESFFHGRYEWFYYVDKSADFDAAFVKKLRAAEWLPAIDGQLCRPGDMDLNDLPEEFPRNEVLISVLGIRDMEEEQVQKENHNRAYAQALGVDFDDIRVLKEHPEEFQKWKDRLMASTHSRAKFPERQSAAPERRSVKVAEGVADAENREYEERSRSVRISSPGLDPVTWLRNQYTNDDGQMICQICEQEMPFRKRNGEYYFEAVEGFASAKEYHALFLAFCPLCAAQYKEFVKRDGEARAAFRAAIIDSDALEIPVNLGEEDAKVRFVQTHYLDLKACLEAMET